MWAAIKVNRANIIDRALGTKYKVVLGDVVKISEVSDEYVDYYFYEVFARRVLADRRLLRLSLSLRGEDYRDYVDAEYPEGDVVYVVSEREFPCNIPACEKYANNLDIGIEDLLEMEDYISVILDEIKTSILRERRAPIYIPR